MNEVINREGTKVPFQGIRRTAARHMVNAWQAPVFHLTVEVNMTEAAKVKQVVPGATLTDLLVSVAAQALIEVPELNVHVAEDGVVQFETASVGIAVAAPHGLTVPVVHDANTLNLRQIAERRKDIVERARTGALTRVDITGGTFTISNLGMMGVRRFDAIVNVPQAAILAVGSTEPRLRLVEGEPVWLPIAEFTLTCDHRAIDGALGATFLQHFVSLLESPISSPS
jgi:pyruvate dehydrogenase E2 component (dihydrolipoamide acetyltransferase)